MTAKQQAVIDAAKRLVPFLNHNPNGVRTGGAGTVPEEELVLAVLALQAEEG